MPLVFSVTGRGKEFRFATRYCSPAYSNTAIASTASSTNFLVTYDFCYAMRTTDTDHGRTYTDERPRKRCGGNVSFWGGDSRVGIIYM
jgi:hypothetical protein